MKRYTCSDLRWVSPLARRRALLAAAVVAVAAPTAWAQERVELKVAHAFPASHGVQTEFLMPWARELEKRAGQRLKVSVHDAASPLGNAAALLERLQTGEVDIVHAQPGAYPGRFPRTNLIEVPFVADRAATGTRVLWALRDKQLKGEYAGLKVLALHTDNGGLLHTGSKKVIRPEDLKGLRLRSPSAAANRMLTAYGATPLGMPPAQAYANLRAGLIDGALFSWDGARQTRVAEVATHHLDGRFFVTPYFLVMTQKRFDALPAEVRKAIDETTGAAMVENFGRWWDKWDQAASEAARKRGDVITTLDATQRAQWASRASPALERYLSDLGKAGVPNAKALYAEMRKLAGAGGKGAK